MIIDLNITNKNILIIGAGREGTKRAKSLIEQGCNITIVSESINEAIYELRKHKNIRILNERVYDGKFLERFNNIFMVIAATNDSQLNREIVEKAKVKKMITYSIDAPNSSDFSFVSIMTIDQIIQIAISTSGKSPIMTRIIRDKIENNIKNIINRTDIENIKVQEFARKQIKKYISNQEDRREFLYDIIKDKEIQILIQKNNIDKVKERIINKLEIWEDNKNR